MKKHFKLLASLMLALCLSFAMVACGETSTPPPDGGDEKPPTVVEVDKTYYDVTVVNGTIKDTTYNHDKVEKDASVTVVAGEPVGNEEFTHWEIGGESVGTNEEYTFDVTANVTVTAVYGTNFSVWDGEYPEDAPETYTEDEDARVVHIGSAEALAYWADMITNQQDGTDKTQYKYSTFDWGVYTREFNSNGGDVEAAVKAARKPDNKWTVSLDCNIDLAGFEWTPIFDFSYAQHQLTFDGNNHVIKNLYAPAYNSGEFVNISMKASGFYGHVAGSDITFKNITFDSAVAEVQGMDAGRQNLAIVLGYTVNNNHYQYFKNAQETVFDNVNIINSKIIGSGDCKKAGFLLGRVGCATETLNYDNKQHVTIKNCTISDNLLVASSILGGMIGHIYSSDADIMDRDLHVLDVYDNTLNNITVISSLNGSDSNESYKFGTLGTWDQLTWTGGMGVGASFVQHPVDFEHGDPSVNFIDLHVGTGKAESGVLQYAPVNTNTAMMKTTLEAVDDEGNPVVKDIFVASDMEFDPDSMGYPDWSGNDEQVIYIVGGCTLTGLDTEGSEVRYISGARNADGDLIVTDAEGNVIGAWVVTDYAGAFVAAE